MRIIFSAHLLQYLLLLPCINNYHTDIISEVPYSDSQSQYLSVYQYIDLPD